MTTGSDTSRLLPGRDPRYRLLDAWRGLACLMVVLHHAGFSVILDSTATIGLESWLRWGAATFFWRMNLGVPLFFVISGYCIAASVDAASRRGLGALRFLGRRLWRIYPPYWAALLWFVAVTAGLDALGLARYHTGLHALQLDSPGDLDATQWVGNLTLTEEWRPLVWKPPVAKVFTRVAWSLCYEEQFYSVCFLALLLAPRRLIGVLAAVTGSAFLIRIAAADIGRIESIQGSFLYLWHEFAIGLAVYWRLNCPGSSTVRRVVEGILVLLGLSGLFGNLTSPAAYSITMASLFGLILIGSKRWDAASEGWAWLRPFRACGRRCYSIYLVHLPVCTAGNNWLYEMGLTSFWTRVLVMVPLVSSLAVAVSWAFFWGVERHFLNLPVVSGKNQAGMPPTSSPLAGEAAPAST
ncbi:acyltransferase family protein [Singulisphaera sp. PoT]|uniref:acyltransferase family protein n=1 Tax=Singulisphaera sp. PoT TaxID=3411797 RepID=UPI003BF56F7C